CFLCSGVLLYLHSFPTRRSSDLKPMTIIFNPSARVLRQFAAAWLVVVSLIGLHQYFFRQRVQAGVVLIAVAVAFGFLGLFRPAADRKSTRLNSSHVSISYAVFCL